MANNNDKVTAQEARTAQTFSGRWPNSRGNPLKHLEVPMEAKEGDLITIPNPNGEKPYGPYRIIWVSNPGNGALTKDAMGLREGQTMRTKPLTKDELAQQNAQLLASLAALEAKLGAKSPTT